MRVMNQDVNPDYPRAAGRRRVVGGMPAAMNPSVADAEEFET